MTSLSIIVILLSISQILLAYASWRLGKRQEVDDLYNISHRSVFYNYIEDNDAKVQELYTKLDSLIAQTTDHQTILKKVNMLK